MTASRVTRQVETRLPTPHGRFRLVAFRDNLTGQEPLAFNGGEPPAAGATVRVHVECRAAETLRSLRCDCGAALSRGLAETAERGGVLIYLRAEAGSLLEKLAGYQRQESAGAPGPQPCASYPDYAVPAAILRDLGLDRVQLIGAVTLEAGVARAA